MRRNRPRSYAAMNTPEHEVNYGIGDINYLGGMPIIDIDCPKLKYASPELREALLRKPTPVVVEKPKRKRAKKAAQP